jgi:hypothetical protein
MIEENKLGTWAGFGLWAVSGLMGWSLYASLVSGWPGWIVASILVVGLEGTKIITWRKGGWYRLLSVGLSCLTLIAVVGAALNTIETRKASSLTSRLTALQATQDYRSLQDTANSLKAQETVLVARLAALPPDFVTASNKIGNDLKALREAEQSANTKLNGLEDSVKGNASPDAPTLFVAIAHLIGQEESNVELALSGFVGLLIEISAFCLVGHSNPAPARGEKWRIGRPTAFGGQASKLPRIRPVDAPTLAPRGITAMDYLRVAASNPNFPRLLGRMAVARKLKIGERKARNLLAELVDRGKVVRDGNYFKAVQGWVFPPGGSPGATAQPRGFKIGIVPEQGAR